VHRRQIIGAAGAVAVVVEAGLPALPGIFEPVFQPAVLLGLRDVDEQLDQRGAAGDQIGLEGVDLLIGAVPLRLAGIALDPLDEDAAVPAAVEDRDITRCGQRAAEAPEEIVRLLLVGRRGAG
jgi:hypothetical protein